MDDIYSTVFFSFCLSFISHSFVLVCRFCALSIVSVYCYTMFYGELEIRSVERGICLIATSTMTEVLLQ